MDAPDNQPGLRIEAQPDDTTCGPTCLHAVYAYFGQAVPLTDLIAEVPVLPSGGTLAVELARHALARGFETVVYTYNLRVFDPTWFDEGGRALGGAEKLASALVARRERTDDRKLTITCQAYIDYLAAGGDVRYRELSPQLLRELLAHGHPLLTGLSATYLYRCPRERDDAYDPIAGEPAGHFVVLQGYDWESDKVMVADPLQDNPRFDGHHYDVSVFRLIGAILLGVLTYDANLLVIAPRGGGDA
ncbi:MAG: C39 family peptidase [Myxococcales bacterium]|nr:C39 family peptidase [Myxococcales bacterium]